MGTVVEKEASSVGAVAGIVVVGWVDAGLPQQAVRRKAHRRRDRSFFTGDHLSLIISLILRYVHFYNASFRLFTFTVTYCFQGDGFAFLRKSHGRANSPPDCLLGPAFRIRPQRQKVQHRMVLDFLWWGRTDSNHRSETQQIYSLSPLATRELPRIFNYCLHQQNICIIP